jgi:hypothetical protein
VALATAVLEGRFVQIDICSSRAGYVLSYGPVSLWLPEGVAVDLLETLARAVALDAASKLPETGVTDAADVD